MKSSNFHPLNWYPVAWITVLVFAALAWDMGMWRDALVVCGIALPVALLGQWVVRGFLRMFLCPTWLRRAMMLGPAILLAAVIYALMTPRHYVSLTLGGHVPWGLREVLVNEDAWTDDAIQIYFRSDPASLRRILEQPPFVRDDLWQSPFSFAGTPFPELEKRPDLPHPIRYRRTDLGNDEHRSCWVCTDEAFSFAYVEYAVD